MRRWACCLVLSVLASMPATTTSQEDAPRRLGDVINDQWANEFWNDGKAEVAEYAAERVIYGAARPHTLHLITVTEDFNKEYWAKADWPYGQKPVLPVVKQNQLATIETPNYPYHFMTSVFFAREEISHAIKMTVSSQEWCGSTFKEFQLYQNPPLMKFNSYWDGQGTGEYVLANHGSETYFEEELPLLVRAINFKDGLRASFSLHQSQTNNKATNPEAQGATASPAMLTVVGYDDKHWKVSVQTRNQRSATFIVGRDYPNELTSFEFSDGRRYTLKHSERRAYWELPG